MGGVLTEGLRQRLHALLAVDGNGHSSVMARICALVTSELNVSGAGVILVDRSRTANPQQRLVWAGDAVATRLEDLQLTVGEGPGLSAVAAGSAVLVPDLATAAARWPAFAAGAVPAGAAAVFAFPLTLGTIRVGSLDCYRTATGPLDPQEVGTALVLAEMAFETVLAEIVGHERDDLGWISDVHAEVHQASGIVMYQQGVNIQEALLQIRGYAFAHDLSITVVARRIVDRELRLEAEE
jgi:hypothetical protein